MIAPEDQVPTPPSIARLVAQQLPADFEGLVIDPAVGGGALLEAVLARLGSNVRVAGVDHDQSIIRRLKKEHPDWLLSTADSLVGRSRATSRAWTRARTSARAAVLNPPFSFRGNGGTTVTGSWGESRVSPSAAFIYTVLSELPKLEVVIAIVPSGTLGSQKDRDVWNWVMDRFNCEVIDQFHRAAFRGVTASTVLVRIVPRRRLTAAVSQPGVREPHSRLVERGCVCVDLVRGRVPMHKTLDPDDCASAEMAPVLHTSDLGSANYRPRPRVASSSLITWGRGIALPRVGKPDPRKIVPISSQYVLSDCVLFIRPIKPELLPVLLNMFIQHFGSFQHQYGGTGAPYLTLKKLNEWLTTQGFRPRHVPASSFGPSCSCGAETEGARFLTPAGPETVPGGF